MAPRRLPNTGFYLPLFTPQLGADVMTTATAGNTASAAAAIPAVDGANKPLMMVIQTAAGGRIRLAFFNGTAGSPVATGASLLVGFAASEWSREVGIPEGATHFSFKRADAADVPFEYCFS